MSGSSGRVIRLAFGLHLGHLSMELRAVLCAARSLLVALKFDRLLRRVMQLRGGRRQVGALALLCPLRIYRYTQNSV